MCVSVGPVLVLGEREEKIVHVSNNNHRIKKIRFKPHTSLEICPYVCVYVWQQLCVCFSSEQNNRKTQTNSWNWCFVCRLGVLYELMK